MKHKIGLNAKKQLKVGGFLTLSYKVIMNTITSMNGTQSLENELVTIPYSIWNMNTPAIKLNISHATNLMKVNLLHIYARKSFFFTLKVEGFLHYFDNERGSFFLLENDLFEKNIFKVGFCS